ncbi:MAG TPA: class 1 fructose-bisphosphatase [Candidatus Polarisedimenticolia bacterium]|nr:class 1 fructose-bisphosphatase [Candidatus Polarisedimenticolia bacterium]
MSAPLFPTLDEFLRSTVVATDLAAVLSAAARGGAQIADELRLAGLAGVLGTAGGTNVQGETVQKMDLRSNEILVETFRDGGMVSLVASEEMRDPLEIRGGGPLSVLFDPLDGSSNLDVDGCVGSIFSVHGLAPGKPPGRQALLRRGMDQAAAGYLSYGPATVLVFSVGSGTHQFTYDPRRKEFLMTARDIRIPRRGRVYAANEGLRSFWHASTRRFIDHLQTPDRAEERPYSTRYSGCLVADAHRILQEGGIYVYPADTRDPNKPHGKLRLLYECAPLAMIVEQAGGEASTGREPICQVLPLELHQRVPLYIGSPIEVALAEDFEAGRC